MSSTAKFIKTSGIYLFGQILVKLIGLLLLPIFTSILSPSDYGYFDVTVATISIIAPVIFLEISTALLRFLFDYNNEIEKNKVVTNVFVVAIISTIFYIIAFIMLGIIKDIRDLPIVFLYGLSVAINSIYQFLSRGFGENKVYMMSGVFNSLIYATTNIIFIVVLRMGIVSLFISGIISNVIQIIIIDIKVGGIRRFNKRDIDLKLIKSMIKFTLPLVINSISVWCATGLGRIIIAGKLGIATNGYIAVADKFLVAISLFSSIVALTWQETAFSLSTSEEKGEKYSVAFNMYIKALGCGILILIPFTYIVFPYLVNLQFNQAKGIIPLYYLVALLGALSTFFTSIFTAAKKTKTIFYSTLLSAIVNLSVLYFMIPIAGIFAYVFAAFAGSTVSLLIRYFTVSLNIIKISIDFKNVIILILFYILAVFAFFKTNAIVNILMLSVSVLVSLYVLKDIVNKIFQTIKSSILKK